MRNHIIIIRFKNKTGNLTRPSVPRIVALVVYIFLGDDYIMIINMNAYFWHVFNTQNHTWPYNIQSLSSVDVEECYIIQNH